MMTIRSDETSFFLGDSESGSARGSSEGWTPACNVTGEWTCELEYVIYDIIEGGVEFRELTTNMDIYYESGATFVWGYLGRLRQNTIGQTTGQCDEIPNSRVVRLRFRSVVRHGEPIRSMLGHRGRSSRRSQAKLFGILRTVSWTSARIRSRPSRPVSS